MNKTTIKLTKDQTRFHITFPNKNIPDLLIQTDEVSDVCLNKSHILGDQDSGNIELGMRNGMRYIVPGELMPFVLKVLNS